MTSTALPAVGQTIDSGLASFKFVDTEIGPARGGVFMRTYIQVGKTRIIEVTDEGNGGGAWPHPMTREGRDLIATLDNQEQFANRVLFAADRNGAENASVLLTPGDLPLEYRDLIDGEDFDEAHDNQREYRLSVPDSATDDAVLKIARTGMREGDVAWRWIKAENTWRRLA
ncbi:hypothetical protein HF995_13315 [Sanguibacter hominis ATCC BAA-789]|uniref:Uncharacterized protein n=1 Tax=Sanguibacter hominis ATCC BAA-789 TaxID=1312740 RepID=A0A9X5IS52_9MICO|nr:hypothetical protein [Sanguibacter hominis]NKX94235.1 hypothetical protein [Sanguibacter hominis ATCC BAA-789]